MNQCKKYGGDKINIFPSVGFNVVKNVCVFMYLLYNEIVQYKGSLL